MRLADRGQFAGDKWEVFATPRYLEFIIVDGLVKTLQMAAAAIVGAMVLGLVLGIGKISDHQWIRLPALGDRGVLPRRPGAHADDLLLRRLRHLPRHDRPLLVRGVGAEPLQRRRARRGLPRRAPRRPEGPGRGGVRHRHAQEPGRLDRAAAAGRQDHDPGDHQPVRGDAEGHQPRLRHRRSRPDRGRAADLPRVPEPRPGLPRDRRDLHRGQPAPHRGRHLGPEALRGREEGAAGGDGRRAAGRTAGTV